MDTSKVGKGLTISDLEQQIHVKVEFYSPSVGWVPIEATEKTDPLRQFGIDPPKAFLSKHIDDISFQLPNRY